MRQGIRPPCERALGFDNRRLSFSRLPLGFDATRLPSTSRSPSRLSTMNPSTRTLYQRIQSSDDSEEPPPNNETSHSQPKHPQPHNTCSSSSSEPSPPCIPTLIPKKPVMIEIKGQTPHRGQDGVYALAHDQQTNPNPNDTILMTPERLADTQTRGRSSSTLDRVKRLQERAGGMADGIQERMRERCFGRSYGKRGSRRFYGGGERKSLLFHDDVVAEKPALEMEARRDGVLKVSDRSFCENGCEALLRAIKNNDKLVELDLSGCHWSGIAWDWRVQGYQLSLQPYRPTVLSRRLTCGAIE